MAKQRDTKGLYKKSRRGETPYFTGINSPYEVPENPEFTLSTAKTTPTKLADQLLSQLDL